MKKRWMLPVLFMLLAAAITITALVMQNSGPEIPPESSEAESFAPPTPPPEHVPPDSAPERTRYQMELILDTEQKTIGGSALISLRNDSEDAWEELCLRDYNAAAIENATGAREYDEAEGNENESPFPYSIRTVSDEASGSMLELEYDGDPTIAYVLLNEPLEPGEQMELLIEFQAEILEDDLFLSWSSAGDHTLFELGQFYPILAVYESGWQPPPTYYSIESFFSVCADYSVTLTLPDSYLVVSTGWEEKIFSDGESSTWRLSGEDYRDFSITAGDNLAYLSKMVDEVELRCYFFPEDPGGLNTKREAYAMLEGGTAAFSLYQEMIGSYPYDKLDIVPSFGVYGGLEYPGLVRISGNLPDYLGEGISREKLDERLSGIVGTTVHEIAHQWFYAAVGNDQYHEAWLDESFASFCERYLYRTLTMTDAELAEYVRADRATLERWSDALDPYLNLPAAEQKTYYYTVYIRGYLFLYDIMTAMGEEAFFGMLRDYYQTFAMREAHTEDFLAVLETHAGDLGPVWELVEQAIS